MYVDLYLHTHEQICNICARKNDFAEFHLNQIILLPSMNVEAIIIKWQNKHTDIRD